MAYELKTKKNTASVSKFIKSIENEQRRKDTQAVVKIMEQITKSKPTMWGDAIIGFGKHSYKYASGHTGDWFLVGLSPRKQNLVLYIMSGFKRYDDLMAQLGKHKTGKSCLYINKLEQIDTKVLKTLIRESVKHLKKKQA